MSMLRRGMEKKQVNERPQRCGEKDYEFEKKMNILRGEDIKTTIYLDKRYRHQS